LITKTRYLDFLECSKNAWLKLHNQDLAHLFQLSDFDQYLIEQGHKVELMARQQFYQGILIEGISEDAIALTQKHIELKTPVIFQAAFQGGQFFIRVDVLEFDSNKQQWNLYEIKATSSTDENAKEIDHIEDATFQTIVMKQNGINVGEMFILHLNKKYVLDSRHVDLKQLFTRDNITQKVQDRLVNIEDKMLQSLTLLQQDERLVDCLCLHKGRSKHCQTFSYSHSHVPEYSVYNIPNIHPTKREKFVDQNIFKLEDVPDDFLTPKQLVHVRAYKTKTSFIDKNAIEQELTQLNYPLYFLDYESYNPAIPLFNGFTPYQQMVFQLSLHILRSPSDSYVEHFEYLHKENSNPSLSIINALQQHIGTEGNIIVWNKSFESGRHKELGSMHPEHAGFLENLNNRMYDLMDIFSKNMYVHPDFKGSASIKNVLPVLVPELGYKHLGIQEGTAASHNWYKMIYENLSKEQQSSIAEDLLQYCKTDTLAMYKIFEHLIEIIQL